MMTSSRPKDSLKGGRRGQQTGASLTAMEADGEVGGLDANMLQSMMNSLRSDIFGKIDDLSVGLRADIAAVRQELKSSIEPLQSAVEAHATTISELERSASDHSGRVTELEAAVSMLTKQTARLEEKYEDLEARSRRNNVRLVGVPEGAEGPRPTEFIAELLRDVLGLEEKPLLDRAHRTLREKPGDGAPPRPIVARVHFFHVRSLILQRAGEASPLSFKGGRISVFPDYTSAVARRRAAFTAVKRSLRSHPTVRFGLLYPAVLKVTMPDGKVHRFEDPSVASEFINKNLK